MALAYVTRDEINPPATFPTQGTNVLHATDYGSIEAELIVRISHVHPLYRVDNEDVYHMMEEATRNYK